MSHLVILPILIPLATAAASLLTWRSPRAQRVLGVAGPGLQLAAAVALFVAVRDAGVVVLQVGDWPAPFGITLVADLLSATMVVLTGLVGTAVAVYSLADVDAPRIESGYFALLGVLLTGVAGAFLTGDLFNLFVFFEVMLIASFVLLALGGERRQIEGALKYVTLNLLSSAFFLMAAGIFYSIARTLNMAELGRVLPELATTHGGVVLAASALLLVSFGIKSGVFPLSFWLAASYHTPPSAVSAVFAGLLTKVGVYAMIRAVTVMLPLPPMAYEILVVVAGLTMLTGVLGAVSQFEIRRILGFHIVSQIGYMVVGIALLSSPDPGVRRLALLGTVFYIAHHIVVKTNLYLVAGVIRRLRGTFDLARLGGLAKTTPWLAFLFLVPALSLAGIPPLSGFWAKLSVIRAGLAGHREGLVAVAIAAGLLTLLSMTKIWNEAFWKPMPEGPVPPPPTRARLALLVGPVVVLALVTVAIGLVPEPLFRLAADTADQLLDSGRYADVVLERAR